MFTFLMQKMKPSNSHPRHLEICVQPSLSIVPIPPQPNETKLKPTLTNSAVTVTNQPDPCPACNEHQCVYNFNHAIKAALQEQLEQILKLKPPDDPSG